MLETCFITSVEFILNGRNENLERPRDLLLRFANCDIHKVLPFPFTIRYKNSPSLICFRSTTRAPYLRLRKSRTRALTDATVPPAAAAKLFRLCHCPSFMTS